MRLVSLLLLSFATVLTARAQGDGVFQRLGTTPAGGTTRVLDASADGDVLVGETFVWDAGTFVDLPPTFRPSAADADGSVIAGLMNCEEAGSPYFITPGCPVTFDRGTERIEVLDRYARTFSPPVVVVTPRDTIPVRAATGESVSLIQRMGEVSADGRTAYANVQLNRGVDSNRNNTITYSVYDTPAVWRGGEPLRLACIPGTDEPYREDDPPDESRRNFCGATGISADGFVIVGSQRQISTTYSRAVVWNGGGSASPLGLAGGYQCSGASGVSGDGSTVTGSFFLLNSFDNCTGDGRPVVWIDGRAELLPFDEDGEYVGGSTVDASYDGSVVIGNYSRVLDSGYRAAEAFVWTRSSGVVLLREMLQDSGTNLSGWTSLSATAIADDGTWIAGTGLNPDGTSEGFRARIPSGFGSEAIVVNVTGDESDLNVGDGICDADGATAGEQCTLRAALEEAGARRGHNEIRFDIPTSGEPATIRVGSELPVVDEPVTIDGRPTSSQTTTTTVMVTAEASYDGDAFRIAADSSVVRGLSVGGFRGWAFRIEGDGNGIYQNAIGIGPNGDPAPNRLGGVLIAGGSGNRVGSASTGNVISLNGDGSSPEAPGVAVVGSGSGNLIRGNAMAGNAGLGIDLGNDGVTPNAEGDSDAGPNGLQNAPRFLFASAARTVAVLDGPEAVLDLYVSPTCDPSGFGEGATYVGPAGLVTGDDATPSYEWTGAVEVGAYVAATATSAGGSTGEFGPCVRVAATEDVLVQSLSPGDPPLDGPDITVSADADPRQRMGPEAGEAFVVLYRHAPEGNAFEGSASAAGGTPVTPDVVSLSRYWRVGVVGGTGTLTACLSLNDVGGIDDPAALLVGYRADPSEPWAPLDSALETEDDETRLCASGIPTDAEIGILANSGTNSVAMDDAPAAALALRAYPNPTAGDLTVEVAVPAAGPVRVETLDTLGRRVAVLHDGVLAAGAHRLTLPASGLPAGVYVVRVLTEAGDLSRAVTVAR